MLPDAASPRPPCSAAAEVRDDVAEQIVRDDHIELRRILHHQQRQRVDVDDAAASISGYSAPTSRNTRCQSACPWVMALLLSAMQTFCRRFVRGVLERVAHDPVNTLVGIHLFLYRHLIVCTGLEPAADADVQAFGVFPEHDEIDVRDAAVFQRTQPVVEQPDGPVVDVQIELEPCAQQDVARVAVVTARAGRRARR